MTWLRRLFARPPASPTVLSLGGRDGLTLADACSGVFICGGTGSGKTSSSGAILLEQLVRAGAIVCSFAVKPGEPDRVCEAIHRADPAARIARVTPDGPWGCDPLSVELSLPGGTPASATAMLDRLLELMQRGRGGGENDGFWRGFAQRVLLMAVTACHQASGTADLVMVQRFFNALPRSSRMVASAEWQQGFSGGMLQRAEANARTARQVADLRQVAEFCLREWPTTPQKVRGSVTPMIANLFGCLLSGATGELITRDTLHPRLLGEGVHVVCDLSVLTYGEPARLWQAMWKMLVDRWALGRPPDTANPVVKWQDEYQQLVLRQHDFAVQSVARQSKLISVAIAQDVQVLRSALGGGPQAEHELDALLNNHMTWVCHAGQDKTTNELLSERIGRVRETLFGGSVNFAACDPFDDLTGQRQGSVAGNFHEVYEPEVRASEFLTLKKGGPPHFRSEAIVTMAGKRFSNGRHWKRVSFPQVIG
jgi:hypothetical protein